MQADVLNIKGEKTGRTIELPDEIFGVEPNTHVVYLAVKQYLAAQRHGNHKVKTRAEVQGASRKLHRHKGGGTVFGPKPHAYDFKLNRKVKDLAKISALSAKAKENSVVVVEDVTMGSPKTKDFAGILSNLKVGDKKALFVIPEYNDNVYMSSRNIPSVLTTLLSDLNTYDLVNADVIVFTESAAKIFSEDDAAVTA
jgi:large subunit ribosomal protein L4